MGFTRQELQAFQGAKVDDLIGPGVKLLFVGINPGLWTAAVQTHFAHPGNRFYPALQQAQIIDREIDRTNGMTGDDRRYLVTRGIGITNVVPFATAKASELTTAMYQEGGQALRTFVAKHQPKVVAIAGIGAYRSAFKQPKAQRGLQADLFEDALLWVVPNPSGLNAHETTQSLAQAYAEPAQAAGLLG